ncbi:MAG: hypothetical protein OXN27_16755 [Candidatus Poribacteria bacterium]|nr:hypothetical protein [Candidatus Poribacteria bacterium]
MTRKNAVRMFTLLIVLGFTTFFGFQANSQTVNTFIESIEARHPAPDTIPEKYEGLQTVKGLMNAFDAAYNQKYSKAKVIALCKGGVVYSSELAISGEIDARHSRIEWLQMLLQRGITIEDFDDYRIYLSKRHTLAFLEDNPDLQEIGFLGMPLMDNQNAYKVAYIDKLVAKRVEDHKKQMERAKKRIESAKERIARAKQQPNPKQVEHARKQIEHATKQLRRAQQALERFQNPIPRQQPNRNMRKKSPYPPL